MKNVLFSAAALSGALVLGSQANAQTWNEVATDDFLTTQSPVTYTVTELPSDTATNFIQESDYAGVDAAPFPAPVPSEPEADGYALEAQASGDDTDTGGEQILALADVTLGADQAAEALLYPYYEDGSIGTTAFGGVAVRATGYGDGYFAEVRTDNSTGFGNYINVQKKVGGTATLITRVYFDVGTNGTVDGEIPGVEISDDAPRSNTWFKVRLEMVGSELGIFVDDMNTPVATYTDPSPIASGSAGIFFDDPFESTMSPVGGSRMYFEYLTIEEAEPPTSVDIWNQYQ